ncbi:hypothetical protein DFH06DRAFT_475334 [Mycena polygramma]|nr:hypothetical protein DFH06DRAFT_475334 [Mycena polygramma]
MACWNCGAAAHCDNPPLTRVPSICSVQHLMEVNEPPSDVEITVLHGFTTSARPRVDALDARIEILQAAMERLTLERDNLAGQVEQCRRVLSPIRCLPPEITCEIFSWTLPYTRRVAGVTTTEAPWYLGHISRSWRETALGFPSLWTSISIFRTVSFNYPREKVSPLAMVETQLIRSAKAPICVDINCKWLVGFPSDAIPLMEAILPHSNRWESFRLYADGIHAFLELLRAAKGHLGVLRTLEIIERGIKGRTSEALDMFSFAPRLREVLLANPGCRNYSPSVLIPISSSFHGKHRTWSKVRSLSLVKWRRLVMRPLFSAISVDFTSNREDSLLTSLHLRSSISPVMQKI